MEKACVTALAVAIGGWISYRLANNKKEASSRPQKPKLEVAKAEHKDRKSGDHRNVISVNSYTKELDSSLRQLYPPIEPYETGYLNVGDGHELYYELSGNKEGKPIICLHGGPGGGCPPSYRRFFDPQAYKIILFDQRGAGKSRPSASLHKNTTWDLVDDIERLRKHLGIDRWVVFGGSWGSCLSLAYAQTYPDPVKALVLRGIFTIRRKELLWFYQYGAHFIFPEFFEAYQNAIPEAQRGDLMSAFYVRLIDEEDKKEQLRVAKAWTTWELSTSKLYVDREVVAKGEDDKFALAFSRIESHYFVHGAWFNRDGQLVGDAHKIAHIPGVIVQGRYDVVCPAVTAWELHKNWPGSRLIMVEDAGHSASEPGILSELVKACDEYRNL